MPLATLDSTFASEGYQCREKSKGSEVRTALDVVLVVRPRPFRFPRDGIT